MTRPTPDPTRTLAARLAQSAPPLLLRKATVDVVNGDGTVDLTSPDGGTIPDVQTLVGAGVTAGGDCWLLQFGDRLQDRIVIGAPGRAGRGRWRRTSSQVVANAVAESISWNAAVDVDDPNDDFDLSGTTVTLNRAGWWRITAGVIWNGDPDGFRITRIIDGSTIYAESRTPAVSGSNTTQIVTTTRKFAAADTIEIEVYQNSGGGLLVAAVDERTFLAVERLG